MKKMVKATLLFASISLLLFGCGGEKQSSTASNSNKEENKYMRLAWWGNTNRDERTIKVAAMYENANPGAKIETETTGWGGYWDKMNTQAASSTLPDLMQQDYAYILQWASRGQLLDLTPYISNGTIDTSKMSQSIIDAGSVNGKVYGICMGTNAMGLCANKEILEKAGVTIDELNWTWEDLEQIGYTIYEKTGVKTTPFGTTDIRPIFENLLRQDGKSFYSADGKTMGFTDTKMLVDFYDMQLRMIKAGAMIPAEEAFVTVTAEEGGFAKEKVWNDWVWSNQLVSTQSALGKPVEMYLMPKIKDSKRPGTYLKPSMFFSIPASAENPDMAAKVLNYYLNDMAANDVLLGERGVPAPSDVLSSVSQKVDDTSKQIYKFIEVVNNNCSPIDPPDPGASGEVLKIFRDVTQEVLAGLISSSDGAKKFLDKANAALAK